MDEGVKRLQEAQPPEWAIGVFNTIRDWGEHETVEEAAAIIRRLPPTWAGGPIPSEGMVLVDVALLRATVEGHASLLNTSKRQLCEARLELASMRAAAAMGDETIKGLAHGLGDDLARMDAVDEALVRHLNIIAEDAVYEGVEIRDILSELQRLLQRGPRQHPQDVDPSGSVAGQVHSETKRPTTGHS